MTTDKFPGVPVTSPIQQFFSGRSVFITGATGFCGKVLLEKLLRSCADIQKVFILLRQKSGKSAAERADALLRGPLFEKVEPRQFDKVVCVPGDISQAQLGMAPHDWDQLRRDVSVVFHAAATIRFNENLKVAVKTNVGGTAEVVRLCREMRQLSALVYVSTAYSNCPQREVDEVVYPPCMRPQALLDCCNWLTEAEFDLVQGRVLGDWPNTYSFSKALAESVVLRGGTDLPTAIFRPSIMVSTWREPLPGWIDNMNGPTMGVVANALGQVRCGHVGPTKLADLVPVDMVASGLIAVAWETADRCRGTRVYNMVSGVQHPITWGEYFRTCGRYAVDSPPSRAAWYCMVLLFRNRPLYLLASFFLELLPACVADILPFLLTGRHKNVDKYLKTAHFFSLVEFFANNEWKFKDRHVRKLYRRMSPADQDTFCFDVRRIRWREYLLTYMEGLRLYLLKDSPDTIPGTRKRLFLCHALLSIVVMGIALSIIFKLLFGFFLALGRK